MVKFEYKVIDILKTKTHTGLASGPELEENELNRLGEEGWELLLIKSGVSTAKYYFKRVKQ